MDEIRNAIYQATGVYVDGAAVADEIREAISSSGAEAGRQWITGQDDVMERWEYFVDFPQRRARRERRSDPVRRNNPPA